MGTNFGHFSWDDDPVGVDRHRGADPTVLATLQHQSELLERLIERLLMGLERRGGEQDTAIATPARRLSAEAAPAAEQLDRETVGTESLLTTLHEELHREDAQAISAETVAESVEIETLADAIAQINALQEEQQQLTVDREHYKQQAEQYFEELQVLQRLTQSAAAAEAEPVPAEATSDDAEENLETANRGSRPAAEGAGFVEDQVIEAERARLAELQAQCEQQVRDIEIRSSLERAKLSRENSELKQRVEELQRRVKDLEKQGCGEGGGRRWMAKLGLTADDRSD